MATGKRKYSRDIVGMIRALAVLFLAIILKGYTTGSFSWQWIIIMTAIVISLLVGSTLMRLKQKSKAN
jgi:general stress protein CsbA